jgi:hypothetical protein
MTSFLEKFRRICSDEFSIAEILFINVAGDGLCFFTSIYKWFQLYNPEITIDYNFFIYTISEMYKINLIERIIEMGFQPQNDDELTAFASEVGLSYPMNKDVPELEIICKIISNMLGVNIMIIRHKIEDRLCTTRQIIVATDSILNILYRFNTDSETRTIFLYNTGGHITLMIPKIIHSNGHEESLIASERIFLTNLLRYKETHENFLSVNDV